MLQVGGGGGGRGVLCGSGGGGVFGGGGGGGGGCLGLVIVVVSGGGVGGGLVIAVVAVFGGGGGGGGLNPAPRYTKPVACTYSYQGSRASTPTNNTAQGDPVLDTTRRKLIRKKTRFSTPCASHEQHLQQDTQHHYTLYDLRITTHCINPHIATDCIIYTSPQTV